MDGKVTTLKIKYPAGFEPDLVIPKEYTDHRFVIGKAGKKPLLAICMNPSAARDTLSDRTVNKVIKTSQMLGFDGWIVVNMYPERATNAQNMQQFSDELHARNLAAIESVIREYGIADAWGAWGDLKQANLERAHPDVLALLQRTGVQLFHFAEATKAGNPRHPLYLKVAIEAKRPFASSVSAAL